MKSGVNIMADIVQTKDGRYGVIVAESDSDHLEVRWLDGNVSTIHTGDVENKNRLIPTIGQSYKIWSVKAGSHDYLSWLDSLVGIQTDGGVVRIAVGILEEDLLENLPLSEGDQNSLSLLADLYKAKENGCEELEYYR